jgi:hypothetical protein
MGKEEPLVNKIFLENRSLLEEIMKKDNLSKKDIINNLTIYLRGLYTDLYLSNDDKKSFKIKDVFEDIPMKLGFYEPLDKENLDPERYVEQFTLTPTEKGKEIYAEYRRLKSK